MSGYLRRRNPLVIIPSTVEQGESMKRLAALVILVFALAPVAAASQNDNDAGAEQTGTATTGDSIGGQSIGIHSVGGTVSLDATNRSEDVDVETGDATASNSATVNVGDTGDDGDNEAELGQSARASSGDAVAGQVVGIEGAGAVDAVLRNESRDIDSETGSADHSNEAFLELALKS